MTDHDRNDDQPRTVFLPDGFHTKTDFIVVSVPPNNRNNVTVATHETQELAEAAAMSFVTDPGLREIATEGTRYYVLRRTVRTETEQVALEVLE